MIVGEGQPASYIEMRDTDEGTRFLHNNSGCIGFLGKDGAWKFQVRDDGTLWCAQLGDINTRIENRASAFANERVAKTGDTMTGDLAISKAWPSMRFFWGGVLNAGWQMTDAANLRYVNFDNGNTYFQIGTNGAVWTSQLGDLNSRIENRASDFAIARSNERVAKTGDTMTGNLVIAKTYPEIQMVWGNVYRWSMLVDSNAQLYFRNGDSGEVQFSIRPDGSLWSKQMGDINGRIEQRCADFANDRLITATNRINNKSARLAYVGELNCGNYGNNMAEPWGGGVITGLQSNNGSGYATGGRGRQLQMSDSNGNWYACGYV